MTTHHRDDEPFATHEQRALRALRQDRQPPADLEGRVIRAVASRRSNLIAGLAAAAVFVAGVWLGWALPHGSPAAPTESATPRFMLLLYEDASYETAADPAARVREYSNWARTLGQAGSLVSGDELGDGGVQMAKTSAPAALSPGQTEDQPRGYFVITAPDEAAATRVAATCPHLRYGGRTSFERF